MPRYNLTSTALSFAVLLCASVANVRAQQPDATKFDQTYEAAVAKAQADCVALWADHNLDPLRDKVPLGEDNKPTPAMLANPERLHAEDKPVADLAIKALGQCRKAWGPAWAMRPPAVNLMIEGVQRKQDARIADLYSGKITWGDFNAEMDRLNGEFEQAVSNFSQSTPTPSAPAAVSERSAEISKPAIPPSIKTDTAGSSTSREVRVALVIGDSNYSNLPKLGNPANDARAIAELLQKIGFTTRLVIDTSEADLRREVRKFASESAKADIAFVFYAGHGAQVSGENYVLPVDIAIPETEADIELTGLKVDDLVNSIRARTKVVFLDACRDNPALFQNLVKGRGSYPKGLAPAVGSNFQSNPGGSVFIAYATDSGSVALDGQSEHSPFTQALLRNLDKPVSIDDMFSLVTREVRLVTKNAQRPYKYASLENIVCLTGSCSTNPSSIDTDVFQQAEHSESDDLKIALQTNSPDALEAYLQAYPESSRRDEVSTAIARLKRAEFDEWTLFGITPDGHTFHYLKINSINRVGTRVAVREKIVQDPSIRDPKTFPVNADYLDQIVVYDCEKPRSVFSENTAVSKSGEIISHYKWGNPELLDMSMGTDLAPGSIGETARNIVCHDEFATPLADKKQLATMNFASLASTVDGNGDIYYKQIQSALNTETKKEAIIVIKMHQDIRPNTLQQNPTASLPSYRTEVDLMTIGCDNSAFSILKSEYYDSENNMIFEAILDQSKQFTLVERSPYAMLQQVVCKPKEAVQ